MVRQVTAKSRFARAVAAVNGWCRKNRHWSLRDQHRHLSSMMRGHFANAVVGEVAPHHRGQMAMLVAEGPVAVFPTPAVDCGHCAGKPAFGRYLPNHVLTVPRPPPDMGEAKEVEGGPVRLRMARAL